MSRRRKAKKHLVWSGQFGRMWWECGWFAGEDPVLLHLDLGQVLDGRPRMYVLVEVRVLWLGFGVGLG